MTALSAPFSPDYAIPPGDTLRDTLEAVRMTQADLARRTGLSTKHINQIILGAAAISPETALAFERVLGVPARFWIALESNHQARDARLRDDRSVQQDWEWLGRMPTRELARRGFLSPSADAADLRSQVLQFFGVASREAWSAVWQSPDASFRRSKVFQADEYATAAWLRIGEIQAAGVATRPYDRAAFVKALEAIRGLMVEAPNVFEPAMKGLCADAGVALVIVEEVKGSRASGATRWLSPTRALIQLSLRYRYEDHFWFSFFHEAAHVLLHGKRETFIDGSGAKSAEEDEADAFAGSHLIPTAFESDLLRVRTPAQARALAARIGVPVGIVIGRAQHERLIDFSVGNAERRKFRLVESS